MRGNPAGRTAAAAAPMAVDLPPLCVRAEVASVSDENRTVDLIFSTGAGVERMDWWTGDRYIEQLALSPKNVRIERLNAGGPLLDAHSAYSISDQIGTVEPGSVKLTGKEARATVRFSKRAQVEPIWQDVRDGIIRSVSVGYRVHKFEEEKSGNQLPVRTAVDWEPFEISLVPMPADAGARVRSGDKTGTNTCVIVTRGAQTMNEETRPETIAEENPLFPAQPTRTDTTVTEPSETELAVRAETERISGIMTAARGARMPQAWVDAMIKDKISLVEAQTRAFKELQARSGQDRGPAPGPSGASGNVTFGEDPLVHVRTGIVNALLHRIAPDRFQLEDKAKSYRGMGALDIGRAFLNARGVRTTELSRSQLVDMLLVRTGLHATADFPSLFEDAANKNLRSAYEAAPQTWQPLAKLVTLNDFKPSRQLQVSDAPALLEILDHGEYTFGSMSEAKESITLKTYGRMFGINRQALINDDLNAFGEIPAAFGRKARDIESDLAWAQITSNPTMGDGNALFGGNGLATPHFNLTSTGTVISVAALGVGRAALRNQKGVDGATLLNLPARYLVVPAALETVGEQFVTQITPALSGSVNPFAPGGRTPLQMIVEPRLDVNSAISWYMATDVSQAPTLYHGVLDGQPGPTVSSMEGFEIDGMKFRCRIDVAFKAADWRAIYKNAGA
jgi:hypothetical protein